MGVINLQTRLQRVACVNENLYVTSTVRYSKISMEQLINYACKNSGIPKAQMAAAFYAINQQIEQFVLNGHTLELGTLGTLYLTARTKAYENKEDAGANAIETLCVKFRQSKRLRNLLATNVTLNTLNISDKSSSTDTEEENENSGTGGSDNEGQEEDPLA